MIAGALVLSAPVNAQEVATQDATFRVRSDLTASLNADLGWSGRAGEAIIVIADHPFRLRLETLSGDTSGLFALQARHNGGDWQDLEAHDFPYPEREVELSFDDADADASLSGWRLLNGEQDQLSVIETGSERMLRLDGGESGVTATYPAPWGQSADVGVATRLRLPDHSSTVDMLFGVVDAQTHDAVRLHADGTMQVLRTEAGAERILAEALADIAAGKWFEVEIAAEAGVLEIEIDGETIHTQDFKSVAGDPGIALAPGGTVDIAAFAIEGVARAPRASIVATPAYAQGDPTTDVLDGSSEPFRPGTGVSLQERAGSPSAPGHSEYEWPIVIRRYADGPTVSGDGDRFEFRMVDVETGAVVSAVARVTLSVPPGHLGGTFVETPGRIGPWQANNGDLYFIMEPSETDNKFMMMKSVDGGREWQEVDGANRPETGDLEAVDSRLVGDTLYIIHQVTDSVRYHRFRTSDHPTHPDSWELRDEVAAEATAIAQMTTLVNRSDGSLVTVFLADRLHFSIRENDGTWHDPVEVDPDADGVTVGPQAVLGDDDTVHLAYKTDDGRIWYRPLSADNTLGERLLLAEGAGTGRSAYGAVLPLVYDRSEDRLTVAYRLADGSLWERSIVGSSQPSAATLVTSIPVVTNAVDSQQAGADLVDANGRLVVLFIDEETRSLFSAEKVDGVWSQPTLRAGDIDGAWVRGALVTGRAEEPAIGPAIAPMSAPVIAYVFDAGSKGGTGMNRFGQFTLDVAAPVDRQAE